MLISFRETRQKMIALCYTIIETAVNEWRKAYGIRGVVPAGT